MADLSSERVYIETCASIRATDDISFKLMGLVPLLSGATLVTFFLKDSLSEERAPMVVMLSLFASLVTLGLFRWELRNIQTCKWLRDRAIELERRAFSVAQSPPLPKLPAPPHRIGKTEAEQWIYSITILAWLTLPVVLYAGTWPYLIAGHLLAAGAFAVPVWVSALRDLRRSPTAGS